MTVTVPMPGGATTATVTFGTVTAAGYTAVDRARCGTAPLPLGYLPAGALFYDVSTTAAYLGR